MPVGAVGQRFEISSHHRQRLPDIAPISAIFKNSLSKHKPETTTESKPATNYAACDNENRWVQAEITIRYQAVSGSLGGKISLSQFSSRNIRIEQHQFAYAYIASNRILLFFAGSKSCRDQWLFAVILRKELRAPPEHPVEGGEDEPHDDIIVPGLPRPWQRWRQRYYAPLLSFGTGGAF